MKRLALAKMTERQVGVARAGMLVLCAASLTIYLSALVSVAVLPYLLAVVFVSVVIAVLYDAQIGLFVGIAAAAVMIGVHRAIGDWTVTYFGLQVLIAALLVLTCVSAGRFGAALDTVAREAQANAEVEPAFGSMGLLNDEAARRQIDAEIVRARLHQRPLTLLIINLGVEPSVDLDLRKSVQRSVVRLIESLLRPTDLPFAFSAHEFGVILPETDRNAAWRVCVPLLDAIAHATVSTGAGRQRTLVTEMATVCTAFTELDETVSTSADLIDAALAVLGSAGEEMISETRIGAS